MLITPQQNQVNDGTYTDNSDARQELADGLLAARLIRRGADQLKPFDFAGYGERLGIVNPMLLERVLGVGETDVIVLGTIPKCFHNTLLLSPNMGLAVHTYFLKKVLDNEFATRIKKRESLGLFQG